MSALVLSFRDLAPEQLPDAGGKGASLARLAQAGFPVPAGFVILPTAFAGEDLSLEAWADVQARLAGLRAACPDVAFAVRSSAGSEDSAAASFAGEFETILNVRADEEIREAIRTVYASRHGERVLAYSLARGMSTAHEIAVVVQQLVNAEASGVLFTADPVTGRRDCAVVSATWGLGEAIVGGLVTPDRLTAMKLRIAARRESRTETLKGVAASSGRVTGPARVLADPEDFTQMQPGEILVAAITTPAWTPLFARASAVVTGVGGPLSHGSIVAREYGIPAVLGTSVATKRIYSGQVITVDGSAGLVTLGKNGHGGDI